MRDRKCLNLLFSRFMELLDLNHRKELPAKIVALFPRNRQNLIDRWGELPIQVRTGLIGTAEAFRFSEYNAAVSYLGRGLSLDLLKQIVDAANGIFNRDCKPLIALCASCRHMPSEDRLFVAKDLISVLVGHVLELWPELTAAEKTRIAAKCESGSFPPNDADVAGYVELLANCDQEAQRALMAEFSISEEQDVLNVYLPRESGHPAASVSFSEDGKSLIQFGKEAGVNEVVMALGVQGANLLWTKELQQYLSLWAGMPDNKKGFNEAFLLVLRHWIKGKYSRGAEIPPIFKNFAETLANQPLPPLPKPINRNIDIMYASLYNVPQDTSLKETSGCLGWSVILLIGIACIVGVCTRLFWQ
jgi:hypothetical protein